MRGKGRFPWGAQTPKLGNSLLEKVFAPIGHEEWIGERAEGSRSYSMFLIVSFMTLAGAITLTSSPTLCPSSA